MPANFGIFTDSTIDFSAHWLLAFFGCFSLSVLLSSELLLDAAFTGNFGVVSCTNGLLLDSALTCTIVIINMSSVYDAQGSTEHRCSQQFVLEGSILRDKGPKLELVTPGGQTAKFEAEGREQGRGFRRETIPLLTS